MIERDETGGKTFANESPIQPATTEPVSKIQSCCRAFEAFGTWFGFGLVVLGILSGIERMLSSSTPPIAVGQASYFGWLTTLVGVAYTMLWHILLGFGSIVTSRLIATLLAGGFEGTRSRSSSGNITEAIDRATAACIRLGDVLETKASTSQTGPATRGEREHRISQIVQAIRQSEWGQATALLDDFAVEYPDDAAHAALGADLTTGKADFRERYRTELLAAKEVNDPERVLELYQVMSPCFETAERPSFDRELAGWFLSLIHRRLRTGTIQVDVVNLATRFSESFAATAEGASVRAALPTLRRSAGLCPRCGQPYLGVAEACANAGATGVPEQHRGSVRHKCSGKQRRSPIVDSSIRTVARGG